MHWTVCDLSNLCQKVAMYSSSVFGEFDKAELSHVTSWGAKPEIAKELIDHNSTDTLQRS